MPVLRFETWDDQIPPVSISFDRIWADSDITNLYRDFWGQIQPIYTIWKRTNVSNKSSDFKWVQIDHWSTLFIKEHKISQSNSSKSLIPPPEIVFTLTRRKISHRIDRALSPLQPVHLSCLIQEIHERVVQCFYFQKENKNDKLKVASFQNYQQMSYAIPCRRRFVVHYLLWPTIDLWEVTTTPRDDRESQQRLFAFFRRAKRSKSIGNNDSLNEDCIVNSTILAL